MELCPDLVLLADVAEIVSARPALLYSPLEVELHRINESLGRTGLKKTKTVQGSAVATKKKLPSEVHSIIRDRRGTNVNLIMEKELTTSDLSRNLGRLSVPQRKILFKDFLTQEERHYLENGGEITVPIVEPCLGVSNLTFKIWAPSYVLTRGWNAVARNQNNGLKKGDLIQLWSFRTGGSVGFAVVKA